MSAISNQTDIQFSSIKSAIDDIRLGKVVIVVDDEDRENEGDFVASAELITPETINFMALHGRGLLCTPLTAKRCEELSLDLMVGNSTDPKQTAFTVSIDLLGDGVTTGISATDRAKTILALMDTATKAEQFSRPGHVFPLIAKEGGVLRRPGHTEAAIDLTKLAGLKPGGVIVEIMNEDGSMARLPQLMKIAERFDLKIINIQDLIAYRLEKDSLIQKTDTFKVPTKYGEFMLHTFEQTTNQQVHFALTLGDFNADKEVPLKVISTKSYYDLFSALYHGETPILERVTQIIQSIGYGAIVFINNVQDSDLLKQKMEQFKRFATDEKTSPILPMDRKDLGIGAQIIKELGICKIQLISQHPDKKRAIGGYGLEIVDTISI